MLSPVALKPIKLPFSIKYTSTAFNLETSCGEMYEDGDPKENIRQTLRFKFNIFFNSIFIVNIFFM